MAGAKIMDLLPLWGVFLVTLLLVLLAVEIGYRFGVHRGRLTTTEKESPVNSMVGASLALLAFLLAFTFGLAASRFDARRHVILEEGNAIGTCYLRADFLPDSQKLAVRKYLREYVDTRLSAVRTGKIAEAVARSENLHALLWSEATAAIKNDSRSIAIGLFVNSLNEVIDVHSKRILIGVHGRIPIIIWYSLYTVAIVALAAMGYHGGLAHSSRSVVSLAVAVTFSVVLCLIADLDRPTEGVLVVSQQQLEDLRRSMAE